jgi:hypothetical protein
VHILDEIQASHAREIRELRQQVEMAERRGYEKGHAAGHAEGLREGYSSRVQDQDKAHLTDSGGYFSGPVTVEAEGDTGDWDVIFHFGADAFKLRQQDAVALDIDARSAIYDGPDTYEEDIDAAMKARIEEDKDF